MQSAVSCATISQKIQSTVRYVTLSLNVPGIHLKVDQTAPIGTLNKLCKLTITQHASGLATAQLYTNSIIYLITSTIAQTTPLLYISFAVQHMTHNHYHQLHITGLFQY